MLTMIMSTKAFTINYVYCPLFFSAGKGMHTVARMAGEGLGRAASVARLGMYSVGHGLNRVGRRTQIFGRKLAGVGQAAARGLSRVGDSYKQNALAARTSLGNGIYPYTLCGCSDSKTMKQIKVFPKITF